MGVGDTFLSGAISPLPAFQNLQRIGEDHQQAIEFQQQQAMRQQQMQRQQQIQQFQMMQEQQAQQREQAQTAFENKRQVAGDMLKAETPEGVSALSQLYGDVLPPQQVMAMQQAALGFQKKLQQERQDEAMQGRGFVPIPPGAAGVSSLSGQPEAGQTVVNDRPYQPLPPQAMSEFQRGELDIKRAQAGAGGLTGTAKNDLWAAKVIAHPEAFSPEEVSTAKAMHDASTLSPDTVDFYADMAISSGQMPQGLGSMGGQKLRAQIMNKVAETAKTLGVGPGDIVAAGAEVAANKSALNNLTKTKTMIDAFSNFTDKQLDSLDTTLENLQKKVQLYDSSLLNKPVVEWAKNIQGSPETQAYLQQLTSTRTEVARLVAGLAGSGATLPVQFEKEWESVISPSASPARVMAFIRQSKIEKINRTKAFEQERQSLVDSFKKNADPKKVQTLLNSMSATPADSPQLTEGPATE